MSLPPKDSLRSRLANRLLRWVANTENTGGDYFTTFHRRPKRLGQIGTWPEPDCTSAGCAIVMQGPVATQDDFTLETLRLYRRNMPQAQLILSTWKDENAAILARIADLGVQVVQSDKPAVPGLFNINMQIVSAGAGVRHAVAKGASWIMKTRTDQRLYEPNVIPFLIGLADTFPITGPDLGATPQSKRIIGVGHGSLKFAPYHLTDQTVFGTAQDMLAYWTPPLQDSDLVKRWPSDREQVYLSNAIGALSIEAVAESYLASHFLMRMGRKLDWTIEDSWRAYRDHFCVADYGTTDFYWVKAQTYTRREMNKTYDHITNRQELSFLEWILLHSGQLPTDSAQRYAPVLEKTFIDNVSQI
jgi:hypothetical protein